MFHFLYRSTIQNSEDTNVGQLNGKKPLHGNWNLREPKQSLIPSTVSSSTHIICTSVLPGMARSIKWKSQQIKQAIVTAL